MKYFITLSLIVLHFVFFSQAPEGFNYQAVIRDNSGNPLENNEVAIKIVLYQGTVPGTIVFEESFLPSTNAFGLVNFIIGQGDLISGDFSTIDWATGPYFVEISADTDGVQTMKLLEHKS